ncbi:GLB1L (predicted) [Pycnogonum litorale]
MGVIFMITFGLLSSGLIVTGSGTNSSRSFIIDYERDCFLKDGEPFRYISGTMHYFRVPRIYWKDRMAKMKILGLNALQTYVDWSQHEPEPGEYKFDGELDFVEYVKLAQKMGLLVIFRPGPYIDAERDFGGLPYWLLKDKHLRVRSSDPSYWTPVRKWLQVLLPKVKPLLYSNGGPIISAQVENEYGSYFTHDKIYTGNLRDLLIKELGDDLILFTVDGDSVGDLKNGVVDGVYATVDFGSATNVETAFKVQRKFQRKGPLVNSEYYSGWLDHWRYPHANVSGERVAATLDKILALNASVNM